MDHNKNSQSNNENNIEYIPMQTAACLSKRKKIIILIIFSLITIVTLTLITLFIFIKKETITTTNTTTPIITTITTTITTKTTTKTTETIATTTIATTTIATTIATITTATTTITLPTSAISTQNNLNWLINGNAESGPCELGSGIIHPTGWNYDGPVTQIHYNTEHGQFWNTDPGPSDRGNCYFYGQESAMTSMWQTVNLTYSVNPSLIDNQTVWFSFSAWLGGYANHDDYAEASLTFIDQANQQVGNITTIGPVLAADRGWITSSVFRETNGLVPIGARAFTVLITMIRSGGATNDGLIDNICVVFY